jgi:NTE family protein
MVDYRVGQVLKPTIPLAVAVTASSAFPPVLSPLALELKPGQCVDMEGTDLHREPYTTNVVLADGGVYDNLGLETIWKFSTVLVSDAGQKMEAEEDPDTNWGGHSLRVLDLIDNQVRSLRKRQIMKAFKKGERKGTYWGIRTDIHDFAVKNKFECPLERTRELARVPTRLKELDQSLQERLINWGFAVCDAALRTHVRPDLQKPDTLPYPGSSV